MKNYLSKVIWGKGALNLLSNLQKITQDNPTILFLRHSAREEPNNFEDTLHAKLTEEGRKGAYAFGDQLPKAWNYRIYSSSIQRCVDTSLEIQKNLNTRDISVSNQGTLDNLFRIDSSNEKFLKYNKRDGKNFIDYWISGFYPAVEVESTLSIAQRLSKDVLSNRKETPDEVLDIYISHDFHLILLLFHWAGELASPQWIDYLDGFLVQLKPDKMLFYYNMGIKSVPYPQWWKKGRVNCI